MATSTLDVDLPVDLFGAQVNIPLIHQVVTAQLAAARQGTHDVKNRGEVAGGGRKPYRQKGTGRARQGSIRAPQYAGGGIVHGPTPRSYAQRTPKKMKAAALRGALSDRARTGRLHVVESFVDGDVPSTKTAVAVLRDLTTRRRVLVVVERGDDVTVKSLRNVTDVTLLPFDQLNTYDVVRSDDVVFLSGAFDAFVAARSAEGAETVKLSAAATAVDAPAPARSSTGATTTSATTSTAATSTAAKSATPAVDEDAAEESATVVAAPVTLGDFGAESAQPLDDGSAPSAEYTVKGNADSMLYHAPGTRWYDATVAEVWFTTTDAAETAGFSKAGARTKKASADEPSTDEAGADEEDA